MRRLLAHRLASGDAAAAKQEWYSIVEGDDALWEVRAGCGGRAWLTFRLACTPCTRGRHVWQRAAAAWQVAACLLPPLPPPHAPAAAVPYRTVPQGISEAYRHIIRAFLVHFHAAVLRQPTKRFDFRGGSVGNFFFAGARTFFRCGAAWWCMVAWPAQLRVAHTD